MATAINFGPVIHEGKSYAYSLGYAAYMMGAPSGNPYPHNSDNYHDFRFGWTAAVETCDRKLNEFIKEHQQ